MPIEEAVALMKNDILLGYEYLNFEGLMNDKIAVAGAICCPLVINPFSHVENVVVYESKLQACALTQLQLGQFSTQDYIHGPPIFVSLGYASKSHIDVLHILSSYHAIIGQVVFMDILATSSSIEYLERILNYPGKPCICIDSFGLCATYLPECFRLKSLPSDDEIIETVCILCNRGFMNQIIISINIRSKLQMRYYGGHGYEWLTESIIPRFSQAGISNEILSKITGINMWNKLCWYLPPKPVEVPVDKLTCYICKQQFIPGNHYEKFEYVYCSRVCLSSHRQQNWKKIE